MNYFEGQTIQLIQKTVFKAYLIFFSCNNKLESKKKNTEFFYGFIKNIG